ncbi:hypothetical protein KJ068_07225 [bacterium]|nr:hypothetical protein [bacterium]
MKTSLKLFYCLFLLLPLAAWSQPESKTPTFLDSINTRKVGIVLGRVLNASQDSTAMAGQEVVLVKYVDDQDVEGARPHTVTDARGRFVFEGLETGERFAYYPLAVLEGIEFSGELVKPTPAAPRQPSDIVIFDPTSSDSAISTAMHHLIIEPGNGALVVREIFLFANRGKHTYVGNALALSGKKIVLQMEAPVNAMQLQFGGELMSCCAQVNGNQIFDTMELKPGMRQIVLNYLLPYQQQDASLVKTIAHPTAAFDVFLLEPLRLGRLTLKQGYEDRALISGAQSGEPFQIRGKNYLRYQAANLAQGSTLSLTIINLPAAPRDYRWLAPVILLLLIATGYALNRWRKSRAIDKRRLLIQQILQLDENFEFGEIDATSYQNKCLKLVQKVLAMEDEGANGSVNEITENARRKSDEDK